MRPEARRECPTPWRALVIDDNVELAENIAEVLTEEGYEAEVFTRASDALRASEERGFDLAFLDVRLPDAVGTDALVLMKQAEPHGEVIVMSGDATLESALATVRGGAFAYLLKPISMSDLLRLAGLALRQVALRREREALVHRLRESEARYRTVVESSPALIVGIDPDGVVTLVNAEVEQTTGVGRSDLVGRPFSRMVPPASRPTAWPLEGRSVEVPLAARNGSERRIEWRHEVSEGITFAIGIDVTEARAFERRARAAEQLAAVGELTAGLAHEIRNPLNSALLELEVLGRRLTRSSDLEGGRSVDAVRAELERLERLLADFLWFARPRNASSHVGDLRDPVETVARITSAEAGERSIRMVVDCSGDTPKVVLDEDRVRQVVFNLVRNAMEAIDHHGTITLRTRASDEHAELQVEDTGPGIPGDPSRVFLPFHTTKQTGTGLGLAIAQRIAVDHGGELRVESRPGRTLFTLTLPRASIASDRAEL